VSEGITGTQFAGDERHPAGDVVMFTLNDGLILSLYPRAELAKDAGVDPSYTGGSGVSIGHFVGSRSEVDHVLELAARAGASVPGPAHERPWGIYSGYFSDPDGHLWEVIYFPSDDTGAKAVAGSRGRRGGSALAVTCAAQAPTRHAERTLVVE
jgi:catechol 2,3-dioxygenase-like lactoylglutathione lyase family enzyme